jgi:hypothetical protein
MNKSEMIANFFTRISQIEDQLVTIGDLVEDVELVTTMINGFPPSWDPFLQGIYARRRLKQDNNTRLQVWISGLIFYIVDS